MKKITKAVFPVAGLGTRFLPVTKASPKEMLPVVDKPLIQYAVEEAAEAGITDMIFITGRNKRAIEDHFDKAYELETELSLRNKAALLEQVQAATPRGINCIYIRQTEALGLGHAVLCAEPVVVDEPFAVLLADDLIDARVPVMKQMVDLAARENASVIGVMNVLPEETGSYGIVEADNEPAGERIGRITRIVEKPKPGTSSSTLAVVGRYVLSPRIFHHLRSMPAGAGGEIQLTDGIARLMREERRAGVRIRRPSLRLRQQAGLPGGHRRLRPAAQRGRRGVRALSRATALVTRSRRRAAPSRELRPLGGSAAAKLQAWGNHFGGEGPPRAANCAPWGQRSSEAASVGEPLGGRRAAPSRELRPLGGSAGTKLNAWGSFDAK